MSLRKKIKEAVRSRVLNVALLQRSNRSVFDFAKNDFVEVRMKMTLIRNGPWPGAGTVVKGQVVSSSSLMVKIKFDDSNQPPKYFPAYVCFKPEDK